MQGRSKYKLQYNQMALEVRFAPLPAGMVGGEIKAYLPVDAGGELHPLWGERLSLYGTLLHPTVGWRVGDTRCVTLFGTDFDERFPDIGWVKLVEGIPYDILKIDEYLRKAQNSRIPGPQVTFTVTYLHDGELLSAKVAVEPTAVVAWVPASSWDEFHPLLQGIGWSTHGRDAAGKANEVLLGYVEDRMEFATSRRSDLVQGALLRMERAIRKNASTKLPLNGDILVEFVL